MRMDKKGGAFLKKIILMTTATLLALSLAACTKQEEPTDQKKPNQKNELTYDDIADKVVPTIDRADTQEYTLAPIKEIEEANGKAAKEIELFTALDVKAGNILAERLPGKLTHEAFTTSYEAAIKEMEKAVVAIENVAKENSYNDSEKEFVTYYKEMLSIAKKKQQVVSKEGVVDGALLDELNEKITTLSENYQTLFKEVLIENVETTDEPEVTDTVVTDETNPEDHDHDHEHETPQKK